MGLGALGAGEIEGFWDLETIGTTGFGVQDFRPLINALLSSCTIIIRIKMCVSTVGLNRRGSGVKPCSARKMYRVI